MTSRTWRRNNPPRSSPAVITRERPHRIRGRLDAGNLADLEAATSGTRVIATRDAGSGPSVIVVHDWWGELRRQLRIQRAR